MIGRLVVAGVLVSAALAGGGVARASTLPNRHATTHVTAAQDQYGGNHVVPPAPSHVFTPPKTSAPSTATPAVTPSQTPSTLAAPRTAPVASTAGTLPYTGLALLKVVLVGLGLLALGFALHRWSRSRPRA